MKEIRLSQGKVALVDNEDFESINQFKWHIDKRLHTIYAVRQERYMTGKYKKVYMHNQIMGVKWIDHINSDGLDNRKINMRPCNCGQNNMNQRPQEGKSSEFKGVFWHKQRKKWTAQSGINGKRKHLGMFKSEIMAALAYDNEAKNLFGEFARLNFPDTNIQINKNN